MSARRKLLVVGWDGGAWPIVTPLVRAGRMPHVAGLTSRGTRGRLVATPPLMSVPLWTSIATGRRLHEHGVVYPVEPLDDHSEVDAATARYRRATPFWELAARDGARCHVVNWPASTPAHDAGGVFVSDLFFQGRSEATVEPADLFDEVRALRVLPSAITRSMLAELDLPEEILDNDENDRRVAICRSILAEAASIQAVTTAAMKSDEWDGAFVVFSGLERAAHAFMPDLAAGRSDECASAFGGAIDALYAFHDAFLGRLLELAGDDANVLLVSDHGVTDDLRLLRAPVPTADAVAALRHAPEGLFVAAGPDVDTSREDVRVKCLDIAPTVLSLLDVPVPADLCGTVPECLLKKAATTRMNPRVPAAAQASGWWDAADVGHLHELSYKAPRLTAGERRVVDARRAAAHAVGRDLLADGQAVAAMEVLRPLVAEAPDVDAYVGALFEACVGTRRLDEAERLLERVEAAGRRGPLIDLGRAAIALERGNADEALCHLHQARAQGADALPELHAFEGEAYRRLGQWRAADKAFAAALVRAPAHVRALVGRSAAQLKLHEDEVALATAREAVRLGPDVAETHDQLGATLLQMGRHHDAETALLKAVELEAEYLPAHRKLLRLYEGPLEDRARAQEVQQRIVALRMSQALRRQMTGEWWT